ncbi:PAS domain S-box protein [Gemmatimonas sp.]|uniref:PAS domain-containing hybrid sensor histidine kinase/response regulator n=1 Tax=Gemmatimonas sp. TaxID=1962908 RepID=UPI003983D070
MDPIAPNSSPDEQLRGENAALRAQLQAAKDASINIDTLLHTAPIGFCFLDRDLRYVRINTRLAEMNGISVQAHVGRHVSEIVPTLVDGIRDVTERIRATGEAVLNHEHSGETPAAPGVTRFWSGSWYPVRADAGELVGFGVMIEEITTRKRDEEQLRAAHDSFRHLVEHSPFGIYAVDADFRLSLVSAGAQKVFEHVHPLIGRDFAEVLRIVWAEPFAGEAIAIFRRVLETGESYHAPNTQETRHDIAELESYDWKVERTTMPDGRLGVVCHFYDLSERQRYEFLIRQQEQRLLSLVETSPLSVVEWNSDAVITRWTGEAEAAYGWSAAEVLGRSIAELELIYEEDRHLVDAVIARLTDGVTRHVTQSVRLWTKERRLLHCVWHHSVLVDANGKMLSVLALGDDVTVQKHAEAELLVRSAELRESEGRYRAAIDVVSDVVWTNNAAGLMEGEQRGWAELTGQSREEYEGYGWANAVHPDDAQPTLDAWSRAVAEHCTFEFEHRVRRYDGDWRVCAIRAVPILQADGTIREWVGVHRDITERKRSEDSLRQLAAELSANDRRKDEFLATLAHELRNPLAPMRNGLELMKLADGQMAIIEQARSMVERQLTQMVRLVDDLMDMSRINWDKLELRKERVSLTAILHHAVEGSRPLIEQLGHELVATFPIQPLIVEADMTRLEQVFLNLLNNAAKYSDRGGRIQLDVARERNDVVVSVKDTGIGIAADQLPRVFEMFTQMDRSLGKSQGGLGIGLTLVKRLVEMHGGTVEATSEGLGKGSTFIVRLPSVIEAPTPQGLEESKGLIAEQSSLRILIVDDNRDSANSLSMMLRLVGNDTRTAYDGQAGVALAGAFRPDVILLDIGLPKVNGYEVCRSIREQSWGKGVLLIAVTGWGQDEDIRRAREAGFDRHMVKPANIQSLTTILAEWQVAHT